MTGPDRPHISFDKPASPPPGAGPLPGWQPSPMYGPPPGYPGYGPYAYPPVGYPPPGPKPSSNIGWAIGAIFLFWPLCIPAFVFATRVDSAWFAGDYAGAVRASRDARLYGLLGVCIGAALIALWLVIVLVFAFTVAG